MFHNLKNNSGFTLIEILASVVLLTVVLSMFLSIFPQMANMNNRTGDNLDAANVGKEVLVKMKKITYGDAIEISKLTDLPIENAKKISTSPNTVIEGNYNSFKVRMTIYPNASANVTGTAQSLYLMKIEVMNGNNTLTTTHGYLEK
ncbi:prepilin-type N-terminal cleavage/methylation domain-containing protein [Psychrobacillus insolitus]|uniref:Prepilin-type N-terminal cleavage/methylation domain-containing protein n=1 Tax=Psychrobacillus insolitus TaxID=1461 RepID=A0A2W7N550_9BACI|nr:prepilin-type N-terminal cleavage/methylation domain-containing protein [Psychrobacillus insolitus]PZX07073.1 prepilin-type N-terminal cleavage/methylation domain-containing protein [Psychrobacillus insolitus]